MKTLILILLSALTMQLSAQKSVDRALKEALRTGDVETLHQYMGNQVELCFPERESIETKDNAARKLRVFFGENPPISYSSRHQGNSGAESKYLIGLLKTENQDYRVFVYVERNSDKPHVKEIRFENPL